MSNSLARQTKPAVRRVQRRVNLLAAWDCLRRQPHTISALANAIEVTRPAVESIVADLNILGWLQQIEPDNHLGRPAVRWQLNPDSLRVLGLDIGAHHCTAMLTNLNGVVLAEDTREIAASTPATERIDASCSLGERVVAKAGLQLSDITLCSVASPGVINQGMVQYFGGRGMPGWEGSDIAKQISKRIGWQTVVSGDCALGALGEAWQGAATGHDEVVYILCGERTGAAAIVGGRIHRGFQGGAGLIGELTVLRWRDIEDATRVHELYPEGGAPSRSELFQNCENDVRARKFVADFADSLSLGTAAMILALAPSHVVVGGKYSAYAEVFLKRFIQNLETICPIMPEVSVSLLGSRAVCLGALRYGLDFLDDELTRQVRSSDAFPSVAGFQQRFQSNGTS